MTNAVALHESVRGALIIATLFLLASTAGLLSYVVLRGKSLTAQLPHTELLASAAATYFILLSIQLAYVSWKVIPNFPELHAGGGHRRPAVVSVLSVLGRMDSLPTFYGGFPYVLVALGVGLWVAARAESAPGASALPGLRRLTLWISVGSTILLATAVWALVVLWSQYSRIIH